MAVGPFNIDRENVDDVVAEIHRYKDNALIKKILDIRGIEKFNPNPRCLLAIEVVFSGSSKHILGDFTNASMMGLIGIVVAPQKNIEKLSRISKYITTLQGLKKLPFALFNNLTYFSTKEFVDLLKE